MTQNNAPGTIEVVRAGPLSTVQDLGRRGSRHLGVAQGGALDSLALEVGNRLVGNRPDAAAVEITIGPAAFRFTRATRIAITGTEFGATLDGRRVYSWWSLPVEAGQTLVLPAAKRGMRGYLCIAGGIDVLPMLGSRSTDLASRFGGLGGRALRDGDRLPVGVLPAGMGCLAADAPEFGVKAPAWCAFARVDEPPRRHRPRMRRGRCPCACCRAPTTRRSPPMRSRRSGTRNGSSRRTATAWVIGLRASNSCASGRPSCCRMRCCPARSRCRRTASRSC
ncbi:allophanate hydrolase subunit 2 family protein [Burkholderia cepacia]|nr:allophanate hydrolase subunit 2 family protein [Burkholderia cepacia]